VLKIKVGHDSTGVQKKKRRMRGKRSRERRGIGHLRGNSLKEGGGKGCSKQDKHNEISAETPKSEERLR